VGRLMGVRDGIGREREATWVDNGDQVHGLELGSGGNFREAVILGDFEEKSRVMAGIVYITPSQGTC